MTVPDPEAAPILVIELWPRPGPDCWACGAETDGTLGIPIYEDLVLPNDWPGEWGGVPACARCCALQGALAEPVSLRIFRGTSR